MPMATSKKRESAFASLAMKINENQMSFQSQPGMEDTAE